MAAERFNWEEAVVQDRDLQRIDALVTLTISKLPDQPFPRADAGRGGTRFQPAPPSSPIVKVEQLPIMVNTSTQFINPRDYQSESSSEIDAREVNPMDELSDFESETPQQVVHEDQHQDQAMDVVMEEEDETVENETVCDICRRSDRAREKILCKDCETEVHVFCLDPPLSQLPQGTWCCAKCREMGRATVNIKEEQVQAATARENDTANLAVNSTTATTGESVVASSTREATSISIAQVLAGDPNKSNLLLIHACNCDQIECTDHEFHIFCPHMKRFLRSVCWASHSDKWRSYRLAQITAKLFAYHTMNCKLLLCNVPLCVKIREEEIV